VRLAAHPAGRHGIDLRRGPLADAVVQAMLAHGGPSTALHGQRISPAMRQAIADHPDPNVRNAYPDFVREMVHRKVSLGIDALEEVYRRPREQLISSADTTVREAVARAWWSRPMDMQRILLADHEPTVRAAATEGPQPGIPPDWRDRCLTDPATRVNAARYVLLTADQAIELIGTGDLELHRAVAANPHLPAEGARLLQESADAVVLVGIAQSRHVDPETRDRIYAHLDVEQAAGNIDAEIALTWNFTEPSWLRDEPLDVRLAYLDCPHAIFRRVLASCPDLPPDVSQRLDNDSVIGVRRVAARRIDAPAHVLERLVREHGDQHHIRPWLVEHPNFPRHRLRTFVNEPDPHVRYLAIRDPDLPIDALRQLASSAEAWLRTGAAGHPNADSELLDILLVDPDPNVADTAAANPTLSIERMHDLLAEADL
jgi:hypothetical protein